MIIENSYINSKKDKELAHTDVAIKSLGYPSVHRVFIVQRENGTLYTIWNLISEGTAVTNYTEERYLAAYDELQKNIQRSGNALISAMTADELRKLNLIFVLNQGNTRIFNSLEEMNEPNVAEVIVSYKDF